MMVMFNFKARFEEPIRAGTKQQTMRDLRRRNARPGDTLQLYTGSRYKPRLIGTATCVNACAITLLFSGEVEARAGIVRAPAVITDGCVLLPPLDRFAVRDGFADWRDLVSFWSEVRGPLDSWSGWLTSWDSSFVPAGKPERSGCR